MGLNVVHRSGGVMVTEYHPEYAPDILTGGFFLVLCEMLLFGVSYLWAVFPVGFLFALGYIMVVRPVIIEYDRHQKTVTVVRPGAFGVGLFTTTKTVSFPEIAWIEVRSRRDRLGGVKSALKIRLKSDEGIDICKYELESGECMRKARTFSQYVSLPVPPKIV